MLNPPPTLPKRLFLARHGESIANQQKWVSGQLDTPLSEKGLCQAVWLCDVLKQEPLSAIYTSTLSRSIDTAKPTADFHGLTIQQSAHFMEMHFGTHQGKALADSIQPHAPSSADGEAYPDFEHRINHQLERILHHMQGTTLIVGHRKTNEVILSRLLGLTAPVNVKNKYLYEIILTDKPTVQTIRLGGEHHNQRFAGLKDV